jgi:serine/threonine-protein kinase
MIRQMAEALEYVHGQGYIHRDICPRNFIASQDLSKVKLIDFGLTVPATEKFMGEGNRTGTPNYMAPEIVRRKPTDQRVDIFAFGVTAYQLLTFELPWPTEDTTGKAAMAHDIKAPVPITDLRPKLTPQLAEAIMNCLSRDPAGRPQSMALFLRAIRQVHKEEV